MVGLLIVLFMVAFDRLLCDLVIDLVLIVWLFNCWLLLGCLALRVGIVGLKLRLC